MLFSCLRGHAWYNVDAKYELSTPNEYMHKLNIGKNPDWDDFTRKNEQTAIPIIVPMRWEIAFATSSEWVYLLGLFSFNCNNFVAAKIKKNE